jgi:iron(III) transport system ATP-binding protein
LIETAPDLKFDVKLPEGVGVGERVEIAIRPENIRLYPAGNGVATLARVKERTFLGNISEYYATLASGQVLRVQTHPLQHFAVDDTVAVEIDAAQCSVFRQ